MSALDPDTIRAEVRERWRRGAAGWGRRADSIQELGMRVSIWMIDQLALQPGQRVLELACGPGDTGFLAAEQVRPGGIVIASDAVDAMLGVAKGRARDLGATNVQFMRLELEWIDLETASVDAVLCRWGLMFCVDPAAALQEIRRVLRPGGRAALAVWDVAERNPWATIPTRALIELGHAQPPDPAAPGMFRLADTEELRELVESAGFVEVVIDRVQVDRAPPNIDDYVAETLDLSSAFAEARGQMSPKQWEEVRRRIAELAAPYTAQDGSVRFPGSAVVVAGST